MTTTEKIYQLGAALWLASDLISDPQVMARLRSPALGTIAKAIKADNDKFKFVGAVSLEASYIAENTAKYEKQVTNQAKGDQTIIEQFAMSSSYLERWFSVLFYSTNNNCMQEMDTAIRKAINSVKGLEKSETQQLLEWLEKQPDAIAKETIFNKIIQIRG